MVLWAGEKMHWGTIRCVGGELFDLVAVFHSKRYEEGWDSYGDPAELNERYAQTCEPVGHAQEDRKLADVGVVRPPADQGVEPRPHDVLGDAAHPMLNIWPKAPPWPSRTRCGWPKRLSR